MNPRFDAWQSANILKDQTYIGLALAGAGLALGWLLIPRLVPAKWQRPAEWVYTISAAGVLVMTLFLS